MTQDSILKQVQAFLDEDIGPGDLTASILPEESKAEADIITRSSMVLCGLKWVESVFKILDKNISVAWDYSEGDKVSAGFRICRIQGNTRALLTAERTALNILQTLSATATISRQYADAVSGTGCKVLDTRKTIPGLRDAQKYAVKCGGCYNHRMGLYDGILIKENHIMTAGSIANAVMRARQIASTPVEVEVENLNELEQALAADPDRIMLDNFSISDLNEAVRLNAGQIELEASGNIGLDTIREIAETGVDYISIGALTKHVNAVDLSMRIRLED